MPVSAVATDRSLPRLSEACGDERMLAGVRPAQPASGLFVVYGLIFRAFPG
jgi:hypothetical protein